MAFEIRASSAVRKDLKRLGKALQEEIRHKHFPKIKEDPFQGHALHGDLRGLRSYHFTHSRKAYRIVYEILKEEKIVLILMIAKREGLYQALRRRLRR